MTAPTVIPVVDEGLGNCAYLVALGDGRGLVVDAARDLRAVRAAAARAGLRITYAADTHLHADFVSGAVQPAAIGGATVLASATGDRAFPHVGLGDGAEVDLGGLRLRALATPGHTPEHVAFLLLDAGDAGEAPVGVFTGGSLLVGSAARTDLAGADRTDELARAQYASLRRLLTLSDATAVWPTHGAGSFCSAPPGSDRTTTIGRERAGNPLLTGPTGTGAVVDEDTFVARLLAGLGSYPAYFARLPEVNRRGPGVIGEPVGLPPLDAGAFAAEVAAGAQVLDVRSPAAFAAGHVPGALSITLRPVFATWLGWLADPTRRILVVRDAGQDPDEIVWQALKVGYEHLAGELAGGITAWTRAGHPVATVALIPAREAGRQTVLDIRQDGEYAAGHVPGAVHVELGALTASAGALGRVPGGPLLVMCGHGERAMTAASLLARAGHTGLAVLDGGPGDWSTMTGTALATGTDR
jgi:glyoxylase-like metal-dependent hydrolase (beta-lactamase superfamily II)/rhodanese-related sulfurtransferase